MTYGMFIDYEYCSGCHTCEVACQKEKSIRPDEFGIECKVIGPFEMKRGHWQMDNLPVPTDMCDACVERRGKGKLASCEQHCQADCLRVGDFAEMAALVTSRHQVVYTLGEGPVDVFESDSYRDPARPAANNYFDLVEPHTYEPPETLPRGSLTVNYGVKKILSNEKAATMLEELAPGLTSDPELLAVAAQGVTLAGVSKAVPEKLPPDVLAFIDRQLRIITDVPVPDLPQGPAGLNKDSKIKDILANEEAVSRFEAAAPGSTQTKEIKMAAKFGMTLADVQKKAPDKMTPTALEFLDMKLREL